MSRTRPLGPEIAVPAREVRALMRRHRVTVRQIAEAWEVPMTRVRVVRRIGGPWDWPLMIARTHERLGRLTGRKTC
jgi:hypothetical protein